MLLQALTMRETRNSQGYPDQLVLNPTFFLKEQMYNLSLQILFFLLEFQTYDRYMFSKRSIKKAFGTEAIKTAFLQASQVT